MENIVTAYTAHIFIVFINKSNWAKGGSKILCREFKLKILWRERLMIALLAKGVKGAFQQIRMKRLIHAVYSLCVILIVFQQNVNKRNFTGPGKIYLADGRGSGPFDPPRPRMDTILLATSM